MFNQFRHRLMISESENANMQAIVTSLEDSDAWRHEIPPRGDFILRLDK